MEEEPRGWLCLPCPLSGQTVAWPGSLLLHSDSCWLWVRHSHQAVPATSALPAEITLAQSSAGVGEIFPIY